MNDNLDVFKEELRNELVPDSNSIFEIKSANQFIEIAKNRPIPRMLFGEFWFEGEICILFADTNLGKSILAVQIANSISTGVSTCGLKLECPPTPIIYFDFELSDKQFENRYSENFTNHFSFSSNFLRAEINPDYFEDKRFKTFEEFLFYSLEKSIIDYCVKVLIVDNITYLKTDNEKAKDALPLMKFLKDLKNKYGLSILVIAHTPKIDTCKPITKNHLSGSKMLMNFCDSSFAIGESNQEVGLRYIKQIKQRNCEHIYDSENIIVCRIEKVNSFLQFSFIEFGSEFDHLRQMTGEDKSERNNKVIELKKQGISNVQIGNQLAISESMVRVILKKNNL
ncbi:AAA family ATPase [Flavobacterium terrisoli]|uniref:AAA family ATPase n=1 Tax=Flavobacterium terrisoli TaxID=3242195 RepID=UPI002543ACBB|nr:AAA family ATPase [Flavobacterium buctense]